jgi:transcription termination factor Rho
MPEVEAIQFLLKQMSRSKSNKEFFQQMVQGA